MSTPKTATVIDDKDYVGRANVAMMSKSFRDARPSTEVMAASVKAMDDADRRAIVLDEIEGVCIMTPAPSHLPSGLALPAATWRADWTD